jgi:hypothetical protein
VKDKSRIFSNVQRTFYFFNMESSKLIIQHTCVEAGWTMVSPISTASRQRERVRYCEQHVLSYSLNFSFKEASRVCNSVCVCVWVEREFEGVARIMSSIDANMVLQRTKRTWSRNTF